MPELIGLSWFGFNEASFLWLGRRGCVPLCWLYLRLRVVGEHPWLITSDQKRWVLRAFLRSPATFMRNSTWSRVSFQGTNFALARLKIIQFYFRPSVTCLIQVCQYSNDTIYVRPSATWLIQLCQHSNCSNFIFDRLQRDSVVSALKIQFSR